MLKEGENSHQGMGSAENWYFNWRTTKYDISCFRRVFILASRLDIVVHIGNFKFPPLNGHGVDLKNGLKKMKIDENLSKKCQLKVPCHKVSTLKDR